jgi:anti-sigma B factor antagonist
MEFYYHGVDRDVLILAVDGGLNAETSAQFIGDLDRVIAAGVARIIVDCSELHYISSYGLGVLARLHRILRARGGDVKLAAVQAPVARLVELTRLNEVFNLFPTVDAAREAFRREGHG